MKDFITTDKGKQWQLVGTSGSMGLYMSESFCGSCYGSKDWAIDFGDGKLIGFADRPSIPHLIKMEYPVTADAKKVWKKVKKS